MSKFFRHIILFGILLSLIAPFVMNATVGDWTGMSRQNPTPPPPPSPSAGVEIICPAWADRESTAAFFGDTFTCLIAKMTYNVVLTPVSKLLSLTGRLFSATVEVFIVNMKTTLSMCDPTNAGCKPDQDIINIGWTLFRDIANIMFIFVLIYIAIRTILLGTSDTAKSVSTVIVVAVLINFSMFFTKVVIDITNVAAISFYNSIVNYSIENKLLDGNSTDKIDNGIAAPFITQTRLATIHSSVDATISQTATTTQDTAQLRKAQQTNYLSIIITSLMGAVFLFILIIIMLIMSVMIISRFIILAFIIMASSLAFGAYILPGLKSKITDKWWSALIGQSFFAPVFLLFLYITLVFLNSFTKPLAKNFGNGFSNILNTSPQVIIGYIVTIGMLIVSIKIAKTLADQAGSASGKITGFVGGAALGIAGSVGRNSIGRGAAFISSNVLGDPKTARGLWLKQRLDNTAERSFDFRNAPGMGSLLKQTGVDMGKGSKNNYSDDQKKREVAATKYAKNMSNEVDPKDKEGRTYREIYQQSTVRAWTGRGSRAVRAKIMASKKTQQDAEAQSAEVTKKIKDLNTKQQATMRGLTEGGKTHAEHTANHTQAQEELETLKAARAQAIANGDRKREANIAAQITAQKNIAATAKAAIDKIEQDAAATHEAERKALQKANTEAEKAVKDAQDEAKKIGQEDEVKMKDLLKALKENKSSDD